MSAHFVFTSVQQTESQTTTCWQKQLLWPGSCSGTGQLGIGLHCNRNACCGKLLSKLVSKACSVSNSACAGSDTITGNDISAHFAWIASLISHISKPTKTGRCWAQSTAQQFLTVATTRQPHNSTGVSCIAVYCRNSETHPSIINRSHFSCAEGNCVQMLLTASMMLTERQLSLAMMVVRQTSQPCLLAQTLAVCFVMAHK